MCPTGQRWNALPEAEKAKYNTGPTGLAASGQEGGGTWVPISAPSLLPAPTTEPFGLGAAPAVPPAASVAPTIPSSSWLLAGAAAAGRGAIGLNERRWGKSVTSKRVPHAHVNMLHVHVHVHVHVQHVHVHDTRAAYRLAI